MPAPTPSEKNEHARRLGAVYRIEAALMRSSAMPTRARTSLHVASEQAPAFAEGLMGNGARLHSLVTSEVSDSGRGAISILSWSSDSIQPSNSLVEWSKEVAKHLTSVRPKSGDGAKDKGPEKGLVGLGLAVFRPHGSDSPGIALYYFADGKKKGNELHNLTKELGQIEKVLVWPFRRAMPELAAYRFHADYFRRSHSRPRPGLGVTLRARNDGDMLEGSLFAFTRIGDSRIALAKGLPADCCFAATAGHVALNYGAWHGVPNGSIEALRMLDGSQAPSVIARVDANAASWPDPRSSASSQYDIAFLPCVAGGSYAPANVLRGEHVVRQEYDVDVVFAGASSDGPELGRDVMKFGASGYAAGVVEAEGVFTVRVKIPGHSYPHLVSIADAFVVESDSALICRRGDSGGVIAVESDNGELAMSGMIVAGHVNAASKRKGPQRGDTAARRRPYAIAQRVWPSLREFGLDPFKTNFQGVII